jgi:ubiquinone/menaquinone biosynthesis C-methylase UbiE
MHALSAGLPWADTGQTAKRTVMAGLRLSAYDLPTRDKIPAIERMMMADGPGLALDIGIGTGYTTYCVFGDRPTVCMDVDTANLRNYRLRLTSAPTARPPLCVVANATALPFRAGIFRFILCSEVMEHVEDDDAASRELGRVLTTDGTVVITVPYIGLGFTSFLELLGVRTVHDFPGPEYHVRPGYDEISLARLMERHGLRVQRHTYYFRLFTRLATDFVSLGHLCYERWVHRRRAWTWSDVTASERSPILRFYMLIFPLLWAFSRLDRTLSSRRGFGLVVAIGKSAERPATVMAERSRAPRIDS